MHMNSVPQHLLTEDRQQYERLLDEALRSAPYRSDPAAGRRLNHEQLRTMALDATALITAAAAAEYQTYVKIREETRRPGPAAPLSARETGSAESGTGAIGIATAVGEVAETTGAGAVAVVAVLAPVLAGTAAALFLLVGYILRMLDPAPAFARTMITAGWVFGALTAAAILVAAVGLLLTALRNRPTPAGDAQDGLDQDVARARDAWREALLERGILPFLREALADPGAGAAGRDGSPAPNGRMPQLGFDRPGYARPGFSSPDDGAPGHRTSYTSPDFTSPDFGGPEHEPE
ncbi:hypothetical protein [Streptomyces tropicalis]|uniref:Transmembrane protein n=1 Tax=Streptomyces tropicalis TaxID=3034234 RepID=A0ABT6AAN9_9ACTN|nr:hypothetical protein [Streptomyces tropicalis]MDF3300875.1 hypothetical protein [Streptomyces tropicalis]